MFHWLNQLDPIIILFFLVFLFLFVSMIGICIIKWHDRRYERRKPTSPTTP